MTEPSLPRMNSIPATPPLLTPRHGAKDGGSEPELMRFRDVFAESTISLAQAESGRASAEQMFESNIQNTREGRRANLRQDYREAVDRRSASRSESRTGVKARRTSAPQEAPTSEVGMPQSVNETTSRTTANRLNEISKRNASLENASAERTSPGVAQADSIRNFAVSEKHIKERATNGEQEEKAPPVSTGNTQTRPAGATVAPGASNPQAAKELARLLSISQGTERGAAPVQGVAAPASAIDTKPQISVAKKAERANETRTATAQSKSTPSSAATEFERLIRLVRASAGRQSSTRVLLDPPELGKVHVRVMVEGDRVEVGVETENEAARRLISDRALKLKTAMEQHGLVIDRFDVNTNQSGLFEPHFAAGQETLRAPDDQNRQGDGRGLRPRTRSITSGAQATATMHSSTAWSHDDMRVDIQV